MNNNQSVSFAIHDLNPWGGQDRSTLEVAKRVSKKIPVKLFCFTYAGVDKEEWGEMTLHKLGPNISRPVIVKYNLYYLRTLFPFLMRKNIVHTTGTTSLLADIVQVQFVQAAWQDKQGLISEKIPFGLRSIYHKGLSKYKVFLEHFIYTKDKLYIAISNSIRDELINYFKIPEENIFVAHHGVDADYFHPVDQSELGVTDRARIRQELGIVESDFAFVLVGALNERKGVSESIEALSLLPEGKKKKTHLMVLGKGNRDYYQKEAEKYGVSDRVHIITHQKDVRPFYWAADGFVLPSHYEPFGLVILEAMACGLPVAASRSAGASELIEEGKSGWLIEDPRSAKEVSQHMEKIIDSDLTEMSKKARQIAVNNSWDAVAEKYVKVIDKCLSLKK